MFKPNAWVDFSWQVLVRYPRALAATLREWLELAPEKVLFGTDAFGAGKRLGWEERAWLGTHTARRALGIALTGMLADGEVTRERAVEIAQLVLHDNAAKLYELGNPAPAR
jgi:predicted TIM-barrel fold metal-dependent hydrolase